MCLESPANDPTSDAPSPSWWKGQCAQCGYSLKGLRRPRCPECGYERSYVVDPYAWGAKWHVCMAILGAVSGFFSGLFALSPMAYSYCLPGFFFGVVVLVPLLKREEYRERRIIMAVTTSIIGYTYSSVIVDPTNFSSFDGILGLPGLFVAFPLTGALGTLPFSLVLFYGRVAKLLRTILVGILASFVFIIDIMLFDSFGMLVFSFVLWQSIMALMLSMELNWRDFRSPKSADGE